MVVKGLGGCGGAWAPSSHLLHSLLDAKWRDPSKVTHLDFISNLKLNEFYTPEQFSGAFTPTFIIDHSINLVRSISMLSCFPSPSLSS